MKGPQIDHLVVAANTLSEGEEFIRQTFGVEMQAGGKHVRLGTHNKVLRLGEACYLEVIAIDPDAEKPHGPRWFELDSEKMRQRLSKRPCLITWAARTDDIESLAKKSVCPLGEIRPMSRGNLHWRLTMTGDGHLAGSGIVPFLIEWITTPHPASTMEESGCSLIGLTGIHPRPGEILPVLESLGVERLIGLRPSPSGSMPALEAVIHTPNGVQTLG